MYRVGGSLQMGQGGNHGASTLRLSTGFGFGRFYLEVPKPEPEPEGLGNPKVGYPTL